MVLSITQLDEIDHIMLTLAKKFQDLLKVDSGFIEADLDDISRSSADETIQIMVQNPRIVLAQKMLQRYKKGKMPLIDDVIAAKTGLLTREAKKLKFSLGKDAKDSSPDLEQPRTPMAQNNSNDADEGNVWPPKLPEIYNATLRNQVFTHSSAIQMPEHLTKAEILSRHNERLEFKGDSVLDYIVCGMLYDKYPNADEGIMTVRKAELVCNSTLWELSMIYELPSRLKTQVAFSDTQNTPPELRSKLVSDLFEAYVGGLAIDRGFDVVREWLEKLYVPFLTQFTSKKAIVSDDVDRMAKTELYQKIGSKDQIPEYITDDVEPPFTVRCVVNGQVIGVGVDHNTKKAGLRAASNALQNREVLEKFADIRRSEPRTAPVTVEANTTAAKPNDQKGNKTESPKQALYLALGGVKERVPIYRVLPNEPAVTVQCICMGEILSQAQADTKSKATEAAALNALKNKPLLRHLRQRPA